MSMCAAKAHGTVWCWGLRLVEGKPVVVRTPERAEGFLGPVVAVASSGYSSCALEASGTVECWGLSKVVTGIPGLLPASVPRGAPVGLPPTQALAMWDERVCAIDTTFVARCWGAPLLGDGSSSAREVPTLVAW